ncbi:MAG: hypothetical protein ACREM8_01445, partial [Vulcanimicrobiaceae bacterium]
MRGALGITIVAAVLVLGALEVAGAFALRPAAQPGSWLGALAPARAATLAAAFEGRFGLLGPQREALA